MCMHCIEIRDPRHRSRQRWAVIRSLWKILAIVLLLHRSEILGPRHRTSLPRALTRSPSTARSRRTSGSSTMSMYVCSHGNIQNHSFFSHATFTFAYVIMSKDKTDYVVMIYASIQECAWYCHQAKLIRA